METALVILVCTAVVAGVVAAVRTKTRKEPTGKAPGGPAKWPSQDKPR